MKDVSNHEILEAIQTFAGDVDARFGFVEKRLTRLEALMVTKDYLDEKLWDLRGDMVAMMRREIRSHEAQFHSA